MLTGGTLCRPTSSAYSDLGGEMIGLSIPLGLALAAATAADVTTTHNFTHHCPCYEEANPILRPIVRSTPLHASVQAGISTSLFVGMHKLRAEHPKTW